MTKGGSRVGEWGGRGGVWERAVPGLCPLPRKF